MSPALGTAGCRNGEFSSYQQRHLTARQACPGARQLMHSAGMAQPSVLIPGIAPLLAHAARKRSLARTPGRAAVRPLAAVAPRVAAPPAPAVATARFSYPCQGGARAAVSVARTKEGFAVAIAVEGLELEEGESAALHWGTYRAGPDVWYHPKSMLPPNSTKDEGSGAMRTPLALRSSGGSWAVEQQELSITLHVPRKLAPLQLAFVLWVDGGARGGRYVGPLRGSTCVVPVGMGAGSPSPLGPSLIRKAGMSVAAEAAAVDGRSVNFALASRGAQSVSLCLARAATGAPTAQGARGGGGAGEVASYLEVTLDPVTNRTGDVWHVSLESLRGLEGLAYGWRVTGDVTWQGGDRFTPGLVMLDPYATMLRRVLLPEGAHVAPSTTTQRPGAPAPAAAPATASAATTYSRPTTAPSPAAAPEGAVGSSGNGSSGGGGGGGGGSRKEALLGSLACLAGDTCRERAAAGDPGRPDTGLEDAVVLELDVRTFTAGDEKVAPQRRGKLLGVLDRLDYIKAVGANVLLLTPVYACAPGLGLMGRAALNFFTPDPELATSADPTPNASSTSAASSSTGQVDAMYRAEAEMRQLVAELHKAGIEVWLQMEFCFTAEGGDGQASPVSMRGIDGRTYYRAGGVLNAGSAGVWALLGDALKHWAGVYGVDGFCVVNAETLCIDREGLVQDAPPLVESIALNPVLRHLKLLAWSGNDSLLPRGGVRGFPHWGLWLERNTRFGGDLEKFLVHGWAGMATTMATRLKGSPDLMAARWDAGLPGNLAAGRRPAFTVNSAASVGRSTLQGLLGDQAWNKGLAKAMLLAALLSEGVPLITQDAVEDPEVARFVGVAVRLRQRNIDLLQAWAFDLPRDIQWHGPAPGSEPDWESTPGAVGASSAPMAFSVRHPDGRGILVAFNPTHDGAFLALPMPPSGRVWARVIDTARLPPDDALLRDAVPLTGYDAGAVHMDAKSAVVLEAVPPDGGY